MSVLEEGRVCRKSSVYNQTGEGYFQQLSSYNRMSAHLRRVLLAPCVVDSRNKRYSRDKALIGRRRICNRSKSLDNNNKTRTEEEETINQVAYDNVHHPLDVLRMNLSRSPKSLRKVKRVNETCIGCSDPSARYRTGGMSISSSSSSSSSSSIAHRSESHRGICPCLHSHICCCSKHHSTAAPKRGSAKTRRLSSDWKRNVRDRSQTVVKPQTSYCYDSDTCSVPVGSPVPKNSESPDAPKFSRAAERAEEAKYAKFIYDITQEIMINGFFTDDELHAIFNKHIDMNSDILDRNKMLSEISQLRILLNVPERLDNDEADERFVASGRFAKFSPEKPPTPPKILDENKLTEKLRNLEASTRFGEFHRSRNVVLVDANPELLITERDVLLTLMEMKLEPREIEMICKSLRNKSRETALSETVQVDAEASFPIKSTTGNRAIDSCQCRCRDTCTNVRYNVKESQTEVEPRIVETLLGSNKGNESRAPSRAWSLGGISQGSVKPRSIINSKSMTMYRSSEIDKKGKISQECLRESEKVSRECSTTPKRRDSIENRMEMFSEEKEQNNTGKIVNTRSLSASQAENRREVHSPVNNRTNQREEGQEKNGDGGEDDSRSVLKTESKKEAIPEKRHNELKRNEENVEIEPTESNNSLRRTNVFPQTANSELLNDSRKDDAKSLPDISERSEEVTEDIETDEYSTIGSQSTSHRSQVDGSNDNQIGLISENSDALRAPSLPQVTEAEKEDSEDSSIALDCEDSESDEDSDENERVLVASLKPVSSDLSLTKMSRFSSDVVDEQERIVAEKQKSEAKNLNANTKDQDEGF